MVLPFNRKIRDPNNFKQLGDMRKKLDELKYKRKKVEDSIIAAGDEEKEI